MNGFILLKNKVPAASSGEYSGQLPSYINNGELHAYVTNHSLHRQISALSTYQSQMEANHFCVWFCLLNICIVQSLRQSDQARKLKIYTVSTKTSLSFCNCSFFSEIISFIILFLCSINFRFASFKVISSSIIVFSLSNPENGDLIFCNWGWTVLAATYNRTGHKSKLHITADITILDFN